MKHFLAILTTCMLCGCAGTKFNVAPGQLRPPFTGEVLVYDKMIPDAVQYTVIGDYVLQKRFYGSTAETARYAAREAAAQGANGILIDQTGHRVTAWSWASPYTAGKLLWIKNHQEAAAKNKAIAPKDKEVAGKPPVEERLGQLEELRKKKVVTEEEYAERRASILKDL